MLECQHREHNEYDPLDEQHPARRTRRLVHPPTSTEVFTAKPGNVTIAFTNDTGAAYGLEVDAPSGEVVGQIPAFNGGTKSLTISVTSGSYTMWCLTNGQKVGLPHTRLNVQ